MSTAIATATAAGSATEASATLINGLRSRLDGRHPSLVMVFASMSQPLAETAGALTRAFPQATVLGTTTSGEFTEGGDTKDAVSAVAVAGDLMVKSGIGVGLAEAPEAAVRAALEDIPRSVDGYRYRTGLLLLDPLSGNGEIATLFCASMLGEDIRLAGGAAGDDLNMSRCEVSCGERVASDAIVAAVIYSNSPLGVGVCHAHRPISEPLSVTKAEGGTVMEVDGRPAWDVWVEQTRGAAAKVGLDPATLAEDQVGAFLLRYEAGLASGDEFKIRAPLSRGADGSLSFACGIPEGAKIRITESHPKEQIDAARTAARRAKAQLHGEPAGAIVFDCICRNLILGDDFGVAIRGISDELGGVPLAGFETYGEIALDAGDLSGFHNTTTVVLAFPK